MDENLRRQLIERDRDPTLGERLAGWAILIGLIALTLLVADYLRLRRTVRAYDHQAYLYGVCAISEVQAERAREWAPGVARPEVE